MSAETLKIDDLEFELRRSPRRRTVQVTVDRGGELVLSAPESCPVSTMEDFVREKRYWIFTKLAEKEALLPEAPKKEFVNGEGFPYLGRSYRLLLVDDQNPPVKLERGRFKMRRDLAGDGRRHMIRWYMEHGEAWLEERVERWKGRVGVEPTGVTVRDLGHRWGSCGKHGGLNFHWRVVLMPPSVIDYIVVHELVHLREPHHTPEFWRGVERVMPDFGHRQEQMKQFAEWCVW